LNGPTSTDIYRNKQQIKLPNWYTGAWVGPTGSERYANFMVGLGLQLTDSIAVLGYDDYGTSVVHLKLWGYNVDALNPSTYVQSSKDTAEDTDIEGELTDLGFTNLDSEWQAVLDRFTSNGGRAKLLILDEDGMVNRSRNNIKSALGVSNPNNITWFICQTHLEVFEDIEAQDMSTEWHKFADNVAWFYADSDQLRDHVVASSPWNLHNTAEWRALLPGDYLIRSSDGQVSVP
jgi:hypothetical protein